MNSWYAGIGSRQTPEDILDKMVDIGRTLASHGYILRSGGAEGADSAFEQGAIKGNGKREIYLPWKGFNNHTSDLWQIPYEAIQMAKKFHPAWEYLTDGAKKLHSRNVMQIFGQDINNKLQSVDFVICWTPFGGTNGGTGMAIKIAKYHRIPVYNLYDKEFNMSQILL